MKIGGLTPASLSDWPGKVAAVVFTQGCNFRCPFCHNSQLIPAEAAGGTAVKVHDVIALLAARRGKLDGVVVSGGEPTLQKGLGDFLREIRALGFAVKLDTNGSKPRALRALIEDGLLDCVAMDVKAPLEKYSGLAGVLADTDAIRDSIELIAQSGLEHEFRTTFVTGLLNEEDMAAIEALIPPGSRHRRQKHRPVKREDDREV